MSPSRNIYWSVVNEAREVVGGRSLSKDPLAYPGNGPLRIRNMGASANLVEHRYEGRSTGPLWFRKGANKRKAAFATIGLHISRSTVRCLVRRFENNVLRSLEDILLSVKKEPTCVSHVSVCSELTACCSGNAN